MMDSRSKALGHLRQSLRAGRSEDLPAQKVSVMADSKKGLEEGLDKAKDLLSSGPVSDMLKKVAPMAKDDISPEEQDEESMESPEDEKSEEQMVAMTDEEIDAMSPEELKKSLMKMRDLMKADEQY